MDLVVDLIASVDSDWRTHRDECPAVATGDRVSAGCVRGVQRAWGETWSAVVIRAAGVAMAGA
jgi:hypothetical protein